MGLYRNCGRYHHYLLPWLHLLHLERDWVPILDLHCHVEHRLDLAGCQRIVVVDDVDLVLGGLRIFNP